MERHRADERGGGLSIYLMLALTRDRDGGHSVSGCGDILG